MCIVLLATATCKRATTSLTIVHYPSGKISLFRQSSWSIITPELALSVHAGVFGLYTKYSLLVILILAAKISFCRSHSPIFYLKAVRVRCESMPICFVEKFHLNQLTQIVEFIHFHRVFFFHI